MRDLDWSSPAPCHAYAGSPICECATCELEPPEWRKGFSSGEPATLESAVSHMLFALDRHREALGDWRRAPRREITAYPMRRAEAQAQAVVAWLTEHLEIDANEVLVLLEIRNAMYDSVLLREVDVTRTFVPAAWRALRLVSGAMTEHDWEAPAPCAAAVLSLWGRRCLCSLCTPATLRDQVHRVLDERSNGLDALADIATDRELLDQDPVEIEAMVAGLDAWLLEHAAGTGDELWCHLHRELRPCVYCACDADPELEARLTAPIPDAMHDVEL